MESRIDAPCLKRDRKLRGYSAANNDVVKVTQLILMHLAVAMASKVCRSATRPVVRACAYVRRASVRSKRLAALTRLSSEIRRKPNLGRNRCVPH